MDLKLSSHLQCRDKVCVELRLHCLHSVYRQKSFILSLQKRRQQIKSVGVNKTEEGMNKKGSNTAKIKGVCMHLRRTSQQITATSV
jgi:hypothetical protein